MELGHGQDMVGLVDLPANMIQNLKKAANACGRNPPRLQGKSIHCSN